MVDRLNTANAQAQNEVKQQIYHWRKVENDYKTLSEQLTILPQKMSHNIMVPFGPLAFIPGQLVHTNELFVHLGDSWFAETTCSQGQKIIEHRLQAVNKNIEDLDKTLTNLEKKTEFSHKVLSDGQPGSQGLVEIKEKVAQDYLHPSRRKRVSRVKESERRSVKTTVAMPTTNLPERNEDLMKRLEELEILEENETNLKTSFVSSQGVEKQVSWSEDTKFDQSGKGPLNIRFKHSAVVDQCKPSDMTPGDIGKIQQIKEAQTSQATSPVTKISPLSEVVTEHKPFVTSKSNNTSNPRKISKFKSNRAR